MSHQICSCEPVCYINSYTLFIHDCLLLIPINILIFMHFANGPSVWKPFLWMAGGLIDLHYQILLLNLEGHMHKNRWWPINLQPPCRSGAVPARRISKFMLLKNRFFTLSLWLGVVAGFGGLSAGLSDRRTHNFSRSLIYEQKVSSLHPFLCRDAVYIKAQSESSDVQL